MMQWYQIISYFLTNTLRLILGLYLVAMLMSFVINKKVLAGAVFGGALVTALSIAVPAAAFIMAVEIVILSAAVWYCLRERMRLCLFLIFFYEVGTYFWEFLISAWLGVAFRQPRFMETGTWECLFSIWLVRLVMTAAVVLLLKRKNIKSYRGSGVMSASAVLGLMGIVTLSQQSRLAIGEDQLTGWIILSLILMFAILLYRIKNQYEIEAEIAELKQEQTEILERDYQTLSRTYADNAKLYHDLHNHIEAIYQCLKQGDVDTAVQYCEQLRTPAQETAKTAWTGDKPIDYLISSKIALAGQLGIETRVNIEYPHNTNIRSADIAAILGNLLDNALEAAETAADKLRFLNLTIRRINDMLIIKVENGCGAAPVYENGMLCTSKKDKVFHGWGIKSVLAAAERYDGTLDTSYDNAVFQAVVTLCYHPVKRE